MVQPIHYTLRVPFLADHRRYTEMKLLTTLALLLLISGISALAEDKTKVISRTYILRHTEHFKLFEFLEKNGTDVHKKELNEARSLKEKALVFEKILDHKGIKMDKSKGMGVRWKNLGSYTITSDEDSLKKYQKMYGVITIGITRPVDSTPES